MQTKKRKEKFKVLTKIILSQLFNQIKFSIKSFILSCKLTFILKNKNNEFIKELLLNSFIFLSFISILIFTFYSKNDYNNNIIIQENYSKIKNDDELQKKGKRSGNGRKKGKRFK